MSRLDRALDWAVYPLFVFAPLPAGWLLRLTGGHAQAALQRDSLARMARDQLFDAAPARAELGYQPRGFQPSTRS